MPPQRDCEDHEWRRNGDDGDDGFSRHGILPVMPPRHHAGPGPTLIQRKLDTTETISQLIFDVILFL
jgi:hypothetical protein